MIPLEALPGFSSWGRHLQELLAQPGPIWVHGAPGTGVSLAIQELAHRRDTPLLDDADATSPTALATWLQQHPQGILGAHCAPEDTENPALLRTCIALRLWSLDEDPQALIPCLEAIAGELEVPLPLPAALGVLPCPGNLLEAHNRVLRWKLLGQAHEGSLAQHLPLETDSVAANLHALERLLLHRALRRSYGNRMEAARRMGISRRQLYLLIDRHGDPIRGSLPVAPPPKRLRKRE
ncbi:MAG: Bacterial regulatory protein, Fis family [Holophagaceae bacterium]|nr:Bacterial regulatory protein, Fis family [Holophagaceae bacterium]